MSTMKFEVGAELVQPIIRDQIAAAVIKELGNTDELVAKMVKLAISQKCNSKGELSSSSYDNRYEFLEVIAGNAIREAAKLAIREIVDKQKSAIQAAIETELKRAPKKTAAAILDAFVQGVQSEYRITADFHINKARD